MAVAVPSRSYKEALVIPRAAQQPGVAELQKQCLPFSVVDQSRGGEGRGLSGQKMGIIMQDLRDMQSWLGELSDKVYSLTRCVEGIAEVGLGLGGVTGLGEVKKGMGKGKEKDVGAGLRPEVRPVKMGPFWRRKPQDLGGPSTCQPAPPSPAILQTTSLKVAKAPTEVPTLEIVISEARGGLNTSSLVHNALIPTQTTSPEPTGAQTTTTRLEKVSASSGKAVVPVLDSASPRVAVVSAMASRVSVFTLGTECPDSLRGSLGRV